jgi:NAD(P)H-dependent FMN reductase
MRLKILILLGPVRKNGCENKAVNFVKDCIVDRGHKSVLIDAFKYKLPVDVNTYHKYRSGKIPAEPFSSLANKISKADAFVIISEEGNYGIPKSLTDLMEHFVGEYFYRPSGIITYSSDKFGGVRAAMQLRSFLSEIGTVSIPSAIRIPKIQEFFTTKNGPVNDDYYMFMNQFLNDLEWYSFALKEGRRKKAIPY